MSDRIYTKRRRWHFALNGLIASVWLLSGLYAKLLGKVPRHRQIVAGILGETHAAWLTPLIGAAEVLMAVWILSRVASRFNAVAQMGLIALMNILECLLVPELLLWGRWNALWAAILILLIGCNEFILNPEHKRT